MPTYRLQVEYDGSAYHGWQVQPDVPTVQGAIEHALKLLARREVRTVGAGRTDRGVHATGQVVSFDLPGRIDCRRLAGGIHGICGPALRVRRCEQAPHAFHARHDSLWRVYSYRILDRPSALWRLRAYLPRTVPPLAELREAGLVVGRKEGKHVFYRLADPRAKVFIHTMHRLFCKAVASPLETSGLNR